MFFDENRFWTEHPEGCNDVYDRSGGTTTLASTGPTGSTLDYDAKYAHSSDDGAHILFQTSEPVVSGDDSNSNDVFERTGGTTARHQRRVLGHGGVRRADLRGRVAVAVPDDHRPAALAGGHGGMG